MSLHDALIAAHAWNGHINAAGLYVIQAVCSLAYNIGTGNLQSSTLRSKLNRMDYSGASDEFPKWRRASGKIMRGLVKRRAIEQELFNA